MNHVVPIRSAPAMPPKAPLEMPDQNLSAPFRDPVAPDPSGDASTRWWRIGVFGPALLLTLTILALFTDFFRMGGVSVFEGVLIGLIAFSFFWIALAVSTAIVGLVYLAKPRASRPQGSGEPLNVALLVPMHNEDPVTVMGNAWAMLDDLGHLSGAHRFCLYLLSDTDDEAMAATEQQCFKTLRLARPATQVFYRWFPQNTERKTGNLGEWIRGWGGGHDAMVVLDADSLMSAKAIGVLTDALAADPAAGLIQSTPRLHGSETLFGRIQQFGNAVYGGLLGAGLSAWSGRDGNFWGHNAIIRTRAFAATAGLPRLGRDRLILSHDFVEAALMRRAGWGVRVLPCLAGTYEEAPRNIVDFVRRDRRWCRGNLQHIRLLGVPGVRGASRFHLFQGAMSYLVSPVWLALLFVWAAIGVGEERSLLVYFSGVDPRPHWPEITGSRQLGFLAFMYGMLLAPKLLGAATLLASGHSARDLGGPARLGASMLAEIALSVAYAPILMVQQTGAILRGLFGKGNGWTPSRGAKTSYGFIDLAKFHWAETLLGLVLTVGLGLGFVTLWLIPIAGSLLLAIPLSALSDLRIAGRGGIDTLMATEDTINRPAIIEAAHDRRSELQASVDGGFNLAAE